MAARKSEGFAGEFDVITLYESRPVPRPADSGKSHVIRGTHKKLPRSENPKSILGHFGICTNNQI